MTCPTGFLRTIDANVPKGLAIHLILDNYATHKHPDVAKWLAKHKRFHLHFTPTSSSWLNLVERWFRKLTDENIRRCSFLSVPDLIASAPPPGPTRSVRAGLGGDHQFLGITLPPCLQNGSGGGPAPLR